MDEELIAYARLCSTPESPLLRQLDRAAHLHLLQPRMLSGHLQGQLLRMLCQMLNPERVLELGAYSGYSTIALAESLIRPSAQIHSIEYNDELSDFIEQFRQQSSSGDKIIMHYGKALDLLPSLLARESFQLVYIDADKREYSDYYRLITPSLPSGAVLLADNTLWSGKVIHPSSKKDPQCAGIQAFNELVAHDPSVEQVLLPIRDGLTIIRKK